MNLYRIDILSPDGTSAPLTDMLGTRLIRSNTAAIRAAREAAAVTGLPAALTRISGAIGI